MVYPIVQRPPLEWRASRRYGLLHTLPLFRSNSRVVYCWQHDTVYTVQCTSYNIIMVYYVVQCTTYNERRSKNILVCIEDSIV